MAVGVSSPALLHLTGLNFIVTPTKCERPADVVSIALFVWAYTETSLIMVLGTPVLAITWRCRAGADFSCRGFQSSPWVVTIAVPASFWFYSHPRVHMILPSMGVSAR